MSFVTCECGSTVFETVRPVQYGADEFYVDARSAAIRSEVNGIPIARCLKCGRLIVPSTSMAGISVLDPRVETYRQVLDAVKYWNSTISDTNVYPSMIAKLDNQLTELRSEIAAAKECACAKEVEDVKTTTGSRKKPKAPVS